MKILFIDHSFHQKTRSSRFFTDRLSERHDLTWLFIDPLDLNASETLANASNFDLAVIWQMDYLAPLTLAQGVPTVVIPMYDGSANMPDLHWLWMREARLVNFCRRLNDRTQALGCTSKLVKYFLPPVPHDRCATFEDGLNILLWQRRPEHGIHLQAVERLFGTQIKSLHIHNAPDDPTVDTGPYVEASVGGYKLTVSNWFETRAEYEAILNKCNVLIAPRRAEGIGMAMLEGLSRGMLVVACDAPTHDEYISNWISGVLFNPDAVSLTNFAVAPALGKMAWRVASDGWAAWETSVPALIDFVTSTPPPMHGGRKNANSFSKGLLHSYRAGLETYRQFLLSNLDTISEMTGVSYAQKIDSSGKYRTDLVKPKNTPILEGHDEWLDQNRMDAKQLAEGRFVVDGAFRYYDDTAWMLGENIKLCFKLDPTLGVTRRIRITIRRPSGSASAVRYAVNLNGTTLGIDQIPTNGTSIELSIPVYAIQRRNVLHIMVDASSFVNGWEEPIGLGFERIELVA